MGSSLIKEVWAMKSRVLKYLENLEGIEKKLKNNISEGKREKLLFLKKQLELKITLSRQEEWDSLSEDKF
ncbi:MAG: hypothetical protein ACPLXL_00265 [Minisyncoccia bacterium]